MADKLVKGIRRGERERLGKIDKSFWSFWGHKMTRFLGNAYGASDSGLRI